MGLEGASSEGRFSAYVEGLVSVIGHADRAKPLRDYCVGLLMPGERKSVEPMAAVTAPQRTAAQHHPARQAPTGMQMVLGEGEELLAKATKPSFSLRSCRSPFAPTSI